MPTATFGVTMDGDSALGSAICHGKDAAIQILYGFHR
jgi:hypothetical protein